MVLVKYALIGIGLISLIFGIFGEENFVIGFIGTYIIITSTVLPIFLLFVYNDLIGKTFQEVGAIPLKAYLIFWFVQIANLLFLILPIFSKTGFGNIGNWNLGVMLIMAIATAFGFHLLSISLVKTMPFRARAFSCYSLLKC